ncbi:MAG TPA: hypothetical protein VFN78_07140 [Ktedonobacterales bacterium]|nr:hypothetical protein [Ktedonobacterales bacterium]
MRGEREQAATADAERRRAPMGRLGGAFPVLAGVFAGLVLCALALLAFRLSASPPPDPAPIAHTICVDLSGQRYDALYALLAPDLQGQGNEAQFAASQRELDRLVGPVRSCQPGAINVSNVSNGVASITLRLQRGSASPATAQVALTDMQGAWRISSYDQNV